MYNFIYFALYTIVHFCIYLIKIISYSILYQKKHYICKSIIGGALIQLKKFLKAL